MPHSEYLIMDRLATVRRLSGVFRYLLIGTAILIGGTLVAALWLPGQGWVSVGDGQFARLWSEPEISRLQMLAIMAPLGITLILGVYWLQRLFGEYQAGHFFTDGTMRCYLWLVWLKVFAFVYNLAWPPLLNALSATNAEQDVHLTIEAGSLIELLVLLLIVHVLREAQRVHDENQAFV